MRQPLPKGLNNYVGRCSGNGLVFIQEPRTKRESDLGVIREALDKAASSETLLPVAKAVKNKAFIRRFLELAN